MWLINTTTFQLEMFTGSKDLPPYAILSHTWGKDKDEVTFKEMLPGVESSSTAEKEGFQKIKMTCALARTEHNLDYAWVDTCCIDKSSSAELSEAINSMFKWYQRAAMCFAFLSDLKPGERDLWPCRWFSRGWTLQELIAPSRMRFFDKSWACIGDKQSLTDDLSQVTGISKDVLVGQRSLSDIPIAVRMSWASIRHTTREEDEAYCLLGIFDVNMPMLYGEGTKAFFRLQQEIIKESADMSIFAWLTSQEKPAEYSGLLAQSPADFEETGSLVIFENSGYVVNDFSTTNRGIKFTVAMDFARDSGYSFLPLLHRIPSDSPETFEEFLHIYGSSTPQISFPIRGQMFSAGILLRQVGPDLFVRAYPRSLSPLVPVYVGVNSIRSIQVVKKLSANEEASINRRILRIREPGDLSGTSFLRVLEVEPPGSWDQSKQLLYAGHTGFFLGYIVFQANTTETCFVFVLICRFDISEASPWRFSLANEIDWKRVKPQYLEIYDLYSSLFFHEETRMVLSVPKEGPGATEESVVMSQHSEDEKSPEYRILDIHLQ